MNETFEEVPSNELKVGDDKMDAVDVNSREFKLNEINKKVDKMSDETWKEYNEIIEKVLTKKLLDITNIKESEIEEALLKIFDVEKKYNCRVAEIENNGNNAGRKIVMTRRRLLALQDLNILNQGDQKELELLKKDFETVSREISESINESKEICMTDLENLLHSGLAENVTEAKDILINGPQIKGFEKSQDVKLSNEVISNFLKNAFDAQILRKCKLAKFEKENAYLIQCPGNISERDVLINKMNELLHKFNIKLHGTDTLTAPDKEEYMKVAMYLEDVDDPGKLEHTFKLRATSQGDEGFSKINFYSFGIEKSDDYDDLKNHQQFDTETEKMKAYVLGGFGHEIMHRIKSQLPEDLIKFNEYKEVIRQSVNGEEFVSNYVKRHKDLYKSEENLVVEEDLCEAVRIYLSNADWLKVNFKSRYEFIKKNYLFIKENAVIDALKNEDIKKVKLIEDVKSGDNFIN